MTGTGMLLLMLVVFAPLLWVAERDAIRARWRRLRWSQLRPWYHNVVPGTGSWQWRVEAWAAAADEGLRKSRERRGIPTTPPMR